jgi:hypothetical protein
MSCTELSSPSVSEDLSVWHDVEELEMSRSIYKSSANQPRQFLCGLRKSKSCRAKGTIWEIGL